MLNTLSIDTETPNIWDFPQKLHSLSVLCAEYSKNSAHSVRFFQKIRKFAIFFINIDRYCVPQITDLSIKNSLIIIIGEIHY